jgi:hypothetical protein
MGEKYGTKETKEGLSFFFALLIAIRNAKKDDGRISFLDIPKFFTPISLLIPAIVGINEVHREVKDMSPEELAELKQFIKTEYKIDDAELEAKLHEGLGLLVKLSAFVLNVKA